MCHVINYARPQLSVMQWCRGSQWSLRVHTQPLSGGRIHQSGIPCRYAKRRVACHGAYQQVNNHDNEGVEGETDNTGSQRDAQPPPARELCMSCDMCGKRMMWLHLKLCSLSPGDSHHKTMAPWSDVNISQQFFRTDATVGTVIRCWRW